MSHTQLTPIRVLKKYSGETLNVTEFLQPPELSIGLHSHENTTFMFPLSGSFRERVDGKEFEGSSGSVLVKPAGILHTHQYGDKGAHCLVIETVLEVDQPFFHKLSQNYLLQILHESNLHDTVAETVLEELLLRITGRLQKTARRHSTKPKWLVQAKEFMDDSFEQKLKLKEIASVCGIHPTHLAEVFPRYFRKTIGHYLRTLRLERAMKRLTETSVPIAEIAIDAGFYDQSHFHRLFLEYTGITPAAARKLASKISVPKIIQDNACAV